MPRARTPVAAERQYVRLLLGWLRTWQEGVMTAALRWYQRHPARASLRGRSDAVPHTGLPFPVETLRTVPHDISAIGQRVAAHNAATYERVVGIPISDVMAPSRIAEFQTRNVALIESLETSQLEDLLPIISEATAAGWASRELQAAIQERFGVGESRAELIARDQVLKLNSQVTRDRHEEAGIDAYIWRTSGDERVRDTHAELEGEQFSYEDPPVTNDQGETNNPGEDYQCRCTADPVLPTYDEETEEGDPEAGESEEETGDLEPETGESEGEREIPFAEVPHPELESAAILPELLEAVAPAEIAEVAAEESFDLPPAPAVVRPDTEAGRATDLIVNAAKETPTGWFGEHKVFISHVHEHGPFSDLTLEQFKEKLLGLQRSGAIVLARADLVGAMNLADVSASEVQNQGAAFHFIDTRY